MKEKPKNDGEPLDLPAGDGIPLEDPDEPKPLSDLPEGHTIGSDI